MVAGTVASIDSVSRRGAICVVACLLVEGYLPVHVPVDRVAAIGCIECLRVVGAEAEVVDILREAVHIVVLLKRD